MTEQTCATGCGRPTRQTLQLCSGCLWAIECDLGDITWLDEELITTLARQTVTTERPDGGKSAETPLPIHTGALKARSDLRAILVAWILDLAGSYELPDDQLATMARWLTAHINDIATHPAAADIYTEITTTIRFAARVVDLPINRTTFPVGPCPELTCPGQVHVFIPAQRDREARMECQACGTRWDPHQWSRAGKRILARKGEARTTHIDSQMAAALLGVTDRTVRRWVETGRLTNHGDERRILIDLAEAERVVDAA